MSYRTVLVDDEPLALKRLRRLLEAHPEIEVVGEGGTVAEGVSRIGAVKADLAFLDIHLPDGTGFDVLRRLEDPPLVIFTTGYDQYALQAFEAAGIDYLLKPVEAEQLERSIGKLRRLARQADRLGLERRLQELLNQWSRDPSSHHVEKLTVRLGDRAILVDSSEMCYFEAKDKYVFLHTTAGKEHIVDQTLSELEQILDPKRFVRVHRSTIVNTDYIREIQTWFGGKYRLVLRDKDGSELVVSKGMATNLRTLIPF